MTTEAIPAFDLNNFVMPGSQPQGSSDPVVNSLDDGFVGSVPDEVLAFLASHRSEGHDYKCIIKRKPSSGGTPTTLPGDHKNTQPTLQEVGERFGPGEYTYVFSFKSAGPSGRKQSVTKECDFVLGEEWSDAHEEYKLKEVIERRKKGKLLIEKARLNAELSGDDMRGIPGVEKSEIEKLKESLLMVKELESLSGKNDNSKMYEMMMENQRTSMMTMMQMSQKSSDTMMQLLMAVLTGSMAKNQAPDPIQHMKGLVDLLGIKMEMNEMMNPQKETMVDKLFGLMEGVLPSILQMVSQKGIAAAQAQPIVKMAKDSEDFNTMVKDPAMRDTMINKLFSAHGMKDTNIILATMGVSIQVDAQGKQHNVIHGQAKTPDTDDNSDVVDADELE